ncbi:MAG: hypothetical protein IPN86_13160 [Saprospiraceae bacterium]|nr:hypothetical protein [Saprospiraceae bacterium]
MPQKISTKLKIYTFLIIIIQQVNIICQTSLTPINNQYNSFFNFTSPSNYWVSSCYQGWTFRNANKTEHFKFTDPHKSGLNGSYVQSQIFNIGANKDITTTYEYLNIFDRQKGKFNSCQITNDQGYLFKFGYQIILVDSFASCVWMTLENSIVKYNYIHHYITEYITTDNSSIRFVVPQSKNVIYGIRWNNGPGIEIYRLLSGKWSKEVYAIGNLNNTIRNIIIKDNSLYLATNNGVLKANCNDPTNNNFIINKTNIRDISLFNEILLVALKKNGIFAIDLKTEKLVNISILKWLNKKYKGFSLNNIYITNGYLIISYENNPPIALNLKNQIESVHLEQHIPPNANICVGQNHLFAIKNRYLTKVDSNNETLKKQFCPYLHNAFDNWQIKENKGEVAVYSLYNLYIYDKLSLKLKHNYNFSNIYFINSNVNGFFITSSNGSFLYENDKIQVIYKNRDYIHIFDFNGFRYAINNQGILVNTADQTTIRTIGFVNHIFQNEKSVILSSNTGVYKLNEANVEKIIPNAFQKAVDFFGSTMDDSGNLWVTSSDGLYYLDLKTKLYYKILLEQFRNFSINAPIYFNNKILVKLENGFTSIHSDCYKLFLSKPKIHKQNFISDNKHLTQNHHYTIQPDYNFLQIQSIVIDSYSDSICNLLYRIPCIDTAWVKTTSSTFNLPTLHPGTYSIEVKAIGTNHLTSDTNIINFTILQPIYQRPWFICLMAISLFTLGYYFRKRRVDKILYKKQIELDKLKALQEQRERLARDLHDEIGSGLSKIKFISGLQPEKDNTQEDIQQLSSTLLRNMRDMLWSLDAENDHLQDLIIKIRTSTNTQLKLTGIQLNMEIPELQDDAEITGFVRRNLLMMVKEAVHNVIKHSNATTIWMKINVNQNQLQIAIKDNGQEGNCHKIIHDQPGKYGLASMRKRALDIGATLDIQNLKTGWSIVIVYPLKFI